MDGFDTKKLITGVIVVLLLIGLSVIGLYSYQRNQTKDGVTVTDTPEKEEDFFLDDEEPIEDETDVPDILEEEKDIEEEFDETVEKTPVAGPELPEPFVEDVGNSL